MQEDGVARHAIRPIIVSISASGREMTKREAQNTEPRDASFRF